MVNFSLPEAKKVLVLAPHPDDEAIGCGGSIALYSSQGCDINLIILTNGEKLYKETVIGLDIAELRRKEAIESSKLLGIRDVVFLGLPDGELKSFGEKIKSEIRGFILRFRPDVILCPSPLDYHDDHLSVAKAVVSISNKVPELNILFYNVYTCPRFNTLVDITDVLEIKEQAIRCYHHSLFELPEFFAESVKGLNRFLAFYTQRQRYYEGFYLQKGPIENNDLLQWYAFGNFESPEIEYLSKLKIADELLKELQVFNESVSKRIEEKDSIIREKDKKIEELQAQLDSITHGLPWKFAKRYYLVRDRLLPEETYRRKLYNATTSFLRSKIK